MSQPVRVLLAGALYLLAVELGVALEHAEGATTFRASAGVGLAVVLLWGYQVLPSIFVVQLAVGLLRGSPFAGGLAVAMASTLSAFAGAYAIRKFVGQAGRFDRVSDVLALIVAAVITTALCPTIALTLQAVSGIDTWNGFATRWSLEWFGDLAGAVIAAPALLVWARDPRPRTIGATRAEFIALHASLVVVLFLAFDLVRPAYVGYALAFVAVPYVIWTVLRFGQHGAVATILVFATISTWQTIHGNGPFSQLGVVENSIYFQAFIVVLSLGTQILAAAIAERERAREELGFQMSLLEAQHEGSIDGIVVVDDEGIVRTANRRFTALWRLSADPVGSRAEECFRHVRAHLSEPQAFVARVAQLAARPAEPGSGEIVLVDGRTLEWHAAPIHGPGGVRYGRAWFFRDITERRRLEEQLRQAQKMEAVGRLAGGIAHDFNNLVTAVQGHARLLLEDLSPDHPLRPDLVEIRDAAERAASLTRQLLAFGRKQVYRPRVIDLNAIVVDTVRMLGRLIGEDIELETALDPVLGHVRADPGQIQQVIMNLALNARDAMPAGGRITISTANVEDAPAHGLANGGWPGGWVLLSVRDTGTGIPADVREHIFEPFFTTKPPGKGTGLGLSTVYGIVQQSSGYIVVDSEVGRGTDMRVYLPRVGSPLDAPEPVSVETEPIRGDGQTILVVEDDAAVRSLARRALERMGYVVYEAASGADALSRFANLGCQLDLLLTDVILPGMNGRDLAERFRALCPDLAIIFMSGYADDEVLRDAARHDSATFLAKPFTPEALAHTVSLALRPRGSVAGS